jgi:hypothetical protein
MTKGPLKFSKSKSDTQANRQEAILKFIPLSKNETT